MEKNQKIDIAVKLKNLQLKEQKQGLQKDITMENIYEKQQAKSQDFMVKNSSQIKIRVKKMTKANSNMSNVAILDLQLQNYHAQNQQDNEKRAITTRNCKSKSLITTRTLSPHNTEYDRRINYKVNQIGANKKLNYIFYYNQDYQNLKKQLQLPAISMTRTKLNGNTMSTTQINPNFSQTVSLSNQRTASERVQRKKSNFLKVYQSQQNQKKSKFNRGLFSETLYQSISQKFDQDQFVTQIKGQKLQLETKQKFS